MLVSQTHGTTQPPEERKPERFAEDFRRFFLRGLAALMPTLITLWLLIKVWDFLWESLGRHLISLISWVWLTLARWEVLPAEHPGYIKWFFWTSDEPRWQTRLLGVLLAIVLVYIVGLFLGNLIGRTVYRLGEKVLFRVPLIRAIYPSVKQVVDFVLADRKAQFSGSRVVAVEPHANGIWSIGLVTGRGVKALGSPHGKEMVTVFIPSSPTAFSGYVLVVPREVVFDLPLTVEQAMRLLVSGGVIDPGAPGLPEGLRRAMRGGAAVPVAGDAGDAGADAGAEAGAGDVAAAGADAEAGGLAEAERALRVAVEAGELAAEARELAAQARDLASQAAGREKRN